MAVDCWLPMKINSDNTNMPDIMREAAEATVSAELQRGRNWYFEVAIAVQEAFQQRFGGLWQCAVGHRKHYAVWTFGISKMYFEADFGRLRIYLWQTNSS